MLKVSGPFILLILASWAKVSAVQYVANFGSHGSFTLDIPGDGSMTYDINLSNLNTLTYCQTNDCSQLSYHLHSLPITDGSNPVDFSESFCGSAALHYDPHLACGGASSGGKYFTEGTSCYMAHCSLSCNSGDSDAECQSACPNPYQCTSGSPDQCEIGDLSGKFGKLTPVSGGVAVQFTDAYAALNADFNKASNDLYETFGSVVFHAPGGSRVLCGNLKIAGGAGGDPHFKTWSGGKFDFHGACDLVLLENSDFKNGLGMNIHIRTKRTRRWSYIQQVAVRLGDDTLEVMGGKDGNRFWLNKAIGKITDESFTLSGHNVNFKQINAKSKQFSIDLGSGEFIQIKSWNGMVNIAVKSASNENFGNSVGLMGSFPSGQLLARDNKTVMENENDFGQEWQVLPTDSMLFHDVSGPQYPAKCDIPSLSEMRRRLGESLISKEDAELACSRVNKEDFDICVFDVMATNDIKSSGAY